MYKNLDPMEGFIICIVMKQFYKSKLTVKVEFGLKFVRF